MELIICFIDDSSFEHALVEDQIAPVNPSLKFVQAYTFEEAREFLGGKIPLLFLLDLWGQDADVTDPDITPLSTLNHKIRGFKPLEDIYNGLETFQGDKINEYLRRLFSIVDCWRNLFEDVCARAGQNRKYGLENLRMVRRHYPGVSAVFYTRKSLINDAVAIVQSGIEGLFIKPTGADDSDTEALTAEYAPKLTRQLIEIIDKNINNLKRFTAFYDTDGNESRSKIETLITSWKEFTNK